MNYKKKIYETLHFLTQLSFSAEITKICLTHPFNHL